MKQLLFLFFLITNLFSYTVYEDKTNSIKPEDITKYKNQFYYCKESSLGVSNSTLWLKINLNNDKDKSVDRFILFTYPALEQIDMFYIEDSLLKRKMSGLQLPLEKRELKFNDFIFQITISADSSKDIYIRVKTSNIFDFSHLIFNKYREVLDYLLLKRSYSFFVFGITFIIFILILLVSIYSDEIIYKIYIVFLFLTFLLQLFLGGYIQYTVDFAHYNVILRIIVDILFITIFVFLTYILKLKKNIPKLIKFINIFILVFAIFICFEPFTITTIMQIRLNYILPLSMFFYLIIIILSIRKNILFSWFMFFSWLLYLILGFVIVLHYIGIINNQYSFVYFQLGIVTEVIIFTTLLLYRFKLIYDEKNEKENKIREQDIIIYRQAKFVTIGETLSNIEHQWRSPLSKISSNILSLQSHLEFKGIPTKEHLSSSLDNISFTLQYMTNLVNNFKNFYTREKEKKNFYVTTAITSAIKLFDFDAKKYHIDLELDIDTQYQTYGYSTELIQVILNFLSNSKDIFIERDVSNPKITLKVSKADKRIYIIICDNAGGVNKNKLDTIFTQFYSSKSRKSTGIGLYMSKIIIENRLNGKLLAKNVKDGLELTINLPNIL